MIDRLGRFSRADVALAALLVLGIALYLAYLPRTLGRADESHFLYEAKRIRDGEVMYRDFFQFVTPGAAYVMAFLFWAFGTSIDTARIATAVLHGLIGVALYAMCRTLGVRRALAVVVPVAYLAICQSAWQFASWHWFGTFFTMLVTLALMRVPWADRPRWAIAPGVVTGLLIAVQQQKGAAIAAGVGVLLLADYLIDRRFAQPEPLRWLVARLAYFAAGVALIVIPLLATFVGLAGFDPVFDALVRFPLVNYRTSFHAAWGQVFKITQGYANNTFPTLLKYLPLALLPACLRIALDLLRRRDRTGLRMLLVLVTCAGSAVLSVWYLPDFIHVAFIAGIFLVAAAEATEWALTTLMPPRTNQAVGWVLAIGLAGLLTLHLQRNAARSRERFPYRHETAFGRIDFHTRWEPIFIDKTRALLSETSSGELFCYPNTSHAYLTTGAKNPTPFQFLQARVSPAQHVQRAVEILETREVPYVIQHGFFSGPADPIARAVDRHYEPVVMPELKGLGEFPSLKLYRRKPRTGGDPTATAVH